MAVRILHCSDSIDNYNKCLEYKVAGFKKRVAEEGDLVYIAVRQDKKPICGARGILSNPTIDKPWEDADLFVQAFKMTDMEYCEPFDLSILAEPGGSSWAMHYLLGSKKIRDEKAISMLKETFEQNKISEPEYLKDLEEAEEDEKEDVGQESFDIEADEIKIMGTFETIKFVNETDSLMGLEKLVNEQFYQLFPDFSPDQTLLIQENKMFKTSALHNDESKSITGVQGVPDAILIKYSKDEPNPIKIILIEYECYGESKIKSIDKFNYLNGHIIPQLMRFASTFSIVTDRQIRENTVKRWTEKLIEYIYADQAMMEKVNAWVKELYPEKKEQQLALEFNNLLEKSFNNNIGIMLIIDELTHEQRDTIKNILGSFKLENNKGIDFYGYVVRLGQRISVWDSEQEYALNVQKFY